MLGQHETDPYTVSARLKEPMGANDQREDYVRAKLTRCESGFEAEAIAIQDSSMMSVFAEANCLIVRPPHMKEAPAGSLVDTLPLDIHL